MRKRKLRTALTGATIALITFALLSFSSATSLREYNRYELSAAPAYTGIFVQQPNKRALHGFAYEFVRYTAETNTLVVPRYWLSGASGDQRWRLHVVAPVTGKETMLKGGLVLPATEASFTAVDKLLPDWESFVTNRGCYLTAKVADELGLKPGDPLLLAGCPFTFIGPMAQEVFANDLRTLTGEPMLSLDYTAMDEDERKSLDQLALETVVSSTEGGPEIRGLDFLRPDEMAVVIQTNRIPGTMLNSIAARTESPTQAQHLAEAMAQRINYPVYYSSGDRVDVLAAVALEPKTPKSMVIPLVIAGLIIFNTMMNSIAERKREIHVYTSLGLAPTHVGAIFLAEALTYGMMGTVFGYVVGQGLATGFSKLGWLGNITLNYSGTQVMYTMALVVAVVVVSALVPAALAARLASPSEALTWKLPAPKDDRIHDLLPFTVTRDAAGGVLAFLHEYFDAHREGAIGLFTCDQLRYLPAADGHLGGLTATIWLEPYDLGVRQEVAITVVPAEEEVCDLHLELRRQAGQDRNWCKLNKTFVGVLRNQILGWRKVSVERVLAYITAAKGELQGIPVRSDQ